MGFSLKLFFWDILTTDSYIFYNLFRFKVKTIVCVSTVLTVKLDGVGPVDNRPSTD